MFPRHAYLALGKAFATLIEPANLFFSSLTPLSNRTLSGKISTSSERKDEQLKQKSEPQVFLLPDNAYVELGQHCYRYLSHNDINGVVSPELNTELSKAMNTAELKLAETIATATGIQGARVEFNDITPNNGTHQQALMVGLRNMRQNQMFLHLAFTLAYDFLNSDPNRRSKPLRERYLTLVSDEHAEQKQDAALNDKHNQFGIDYFELQCIYFEIDHAFKNCQLDVSGFFKKYNKNPSDLRLAAWAATSARTCTALNDENLSNALFYLTQLECEPKSMFYPGYQKACQEVAGLFDSKVVKQVKAVETYKNKHNNPETLKKILPLIGLFKLHPAAVEFMEKENQNKLSPKQNSSVN